MYVRVWEYDVATDRTDAFVSAYGPDGDWARLFARHPGHLRTDLHRSTTDPSVFLSVDRWVDEASWREFLAAHRAEYAALDRRLVGLSGRNEVLVEGST